VLGDDVLQAFAAALNVEDSPIGRDILEQLVENARIAREEQRPICQDTGVAAIRVELGQDVHLEGGRLDDAINDGVRRGYGEGYLRKSIVRHPLDRVNTGDNTPASLHVELVPGEQVRIAVLPKGGGCENMSRFKMLTPAAGAEGVRAFVLDCVREAGPNPCPPTVIGVGIGGTFDGSAWLAKRALFRPVGSVSPDPIMAALERDLLEAVDETGVGPSGLGGRTTALAVHIEWAPCHITSLPVSVCFNCHAARYREAVL